MVRLILVLALALAGFVAVRYYQDYRSLAALAEPLSPGEAVSDLLFTPSFPNPLAQLSGPGITVIATGKLSNFELVEAESGKTIGRASILETVTKDSAGKLKKLRFILQLSPTGDPQRNLIPWIIARAADLQGLSGTKSSEIATNDQLAQIFSRGSKWIFIPITDLSSDDIWKPLPEYQFYARSYYGDKLANFRAFIEDGLLGSWKKPILLLDIFYLFP